MPGAHAGEQQGNSSQTEDDQVVASQGGASSCQSSTGAANCQGQTDSTDQQSGQSVTLGHEGGVLGLNTIVGEGQTSDDTRNNNGHSGVVGAEGDQATEDLSDDEVSNQVSDDTEDTTDDQDVSLAQVGQTLTQSATVVDVALLLSISGCSSTGCEAHVGAQDGAESDGSGNAISDTSASGNTSDNSHDTSHDESVDSTDGCSQQTCTEGSQNVEQNHKLPPKIFIKFNLERSYR